MKIDKVKKYYWFLGIVIIGILVYAFSIIRGRPVQKLTYVEIKDYKGEKLSSISDFRENSIKGPQQININSYSLKLTGLVNSEKSFTYDDVVKKHQSFEKVVTLNCVEGWDVTILWQGVLLKDLLQETGISPKANTVIFYAVDGYTTSLPLDYILNNNIMLAYKMNGITLPPERGFPFELVAESKLGYKWIRWVTKIELSDNKDYKGYWESNGYPNDADVK